MSLIDHARAELARINFGEEDSAVVVAILEKFFDHFDSGGAVFVAAPVLMKLLLAQPLTPLTGADDEWLEVDGDVLQNRRCSTVFKNKSDGFAYDVDVPGRPLVIFPYDPPLVVRATPVMAVVLRRED